MKKLWDILRFAGLLVGIVLLVVFMFFDLIDLIVPGDFPNWLYNVCLIAWAVFGVGEIVVFVKQWKK